MSLVTYEDVRPWARLIKQRVSERAMPPWFSNAHVGEYSNDPISQAFPIGFATPR